MFVYKDESEFYYNAIIDRAIKNCIFSQHFPDIAEFWFSECKRVSFICELIFHTFFSMKKSAQAHIYTMHVILKSHVPKLKIISDGQQTEAVGSHELCSDKNWVKNQTLI